MDLRRGLPVGARAELAHCPGQSCAPGGLDLDGNDVSIEAEELEARCFQHEIDHLDGVLLLERLDDDQRREAPDPPGAGVQLLGGC